MATKTFYFEGTTKWCKVQKPDESPEYGSKYKVPLYLDDASWEEFDLSGSRLKQKEDDDGTYVTFNRNAEDGKPGVFIRKGDKDVPFDGLVGNGSRISVKAEVYDTKRYGKGTRLMAISVLDLVEYKAEAADPTKMPF